MKSESATKKKSAGKKAAKTTAKKAARATQAKAAKKTAAKKKAAPKKSAPKKPAPKKAVSKRSASKKVTSKDSATKRTPAKTPAKAPAKTVTGTPGAKKTGVRRGGESPSRERAAKATTSSGSSTKRSAAKDKALAAQVPSRADFSKPPLPHPIDPGLAADKFRNALRGPLRESGLPRRIAHGAILPALLAQGRVDQLREQLDWALEERVPAFYLAESLLQSYLFVGFPRTINALATLHEVARTRRRGLGLAADPLHVPSEIPSLDRILGGPGDFGSALKGRRIRLAEGPPMHLESPGEGPGSFERYAREWWRRGTELCRTVYGSQYPRLRENLGRIHPELADWMVFEGYGKVLSRPVLTPRERELWIIPLLLSQNVPEQLYSHLRGAQHLDVPMSRIRAVLWLASAITGVDTLKTATELLAEIESRDDKRDDRFRPIF